MRDSSGCGGRRLLSLLCGILCFSAPALAQEVTPAAQLSGGYSFVRDLTVDQNAHGWLAAVDGNFNRWLGVAGEIGGNYATIRVIGSDLDLSIHSFLAGPRFSARTSTTTPFAHLFMGGVNGSASFLGERESNTNFALQPGGGVDFWLRPKFGIRVGGDYRRIFAERDSNEFRLQLGVVFAAGSR